MGSCALIGYFFGALTILFIDDKLGRLPLIRIGVFLVTLNGFLCLAADSFWAFFVFRVLTGYSIGLVVSPALAYTADIIPKEVRGKFISLTGVTFTLG